MKSIICCMLSVLFGLNSICQAEIIYVSTNSPTPGPGTAWSNAFQTIQSAVDVASAGDTVLVTNGLYNTGTAALSNSLCRVALTNAITLQSVNGPEWTFISGADDPNTPNGSNSVRCIYLASGAFVTGFTLTNGYTQMDIGFDPIYAAGGAAYLDQGSRISNCIMRNASSAFGAVFCGADSTVQNCTIRNNSAMIAGGIFLYQSGYISHCTINSNSAEIMGGGAYLMGGILEHSTIGNNQSEEGAGIYNMGGVVRSCTITNNSASTSGGGVYLAEGSVLENSTIGNNQSEAAAGVYSEYSTVRSCIITDNSAHHGAGLYCIGSTVYNCLIVSNDAQIAGGLASEGSQVENCTLVGNRAEELMGGAYCDTNTAIKNTIIYYNTAPLDPNWPESEFTSPYTYCNTTPNPGGEGCFSTPPLFMNRTTEDFRLRYDSPCVDTGTTLSGVTNDILGTARPLGDDNLFDVGAYEYNPDTTDSDGDGRTDTDDIAMGYHPGFDESIVVQNLLTDIQNNPSSYGLYPIDSIGELSMGAIMVQTSSSNTLHLSLQLEQCADLAYGVWTHAGDAVDWNIATETNTAFYRVSSQFGLPTPDAPLP